MSSAPNPGDPISDSDREALIDAIEADRRLFPRRLYVQALDYARKYLGMQHPAEAELWDYILDRLRNATPWRYANLDDYPDRFGYALENADGRGLYIKLRFSDEAEAVVMSFHD